MNHHGRFIVPIEMSNVKRIMYITPFYFYLLSNYNNKSSWTFILGIVCTTHWFKKNNYNNIIIQYSRFFSRWFVTVGNATCSCSASANIYSYLRLFNNIIVNLPHLKINNQSYLYIKVLFFVLILLVCWMFS